MKVISLFLTLALAASSYAEDAKTPEEPKGPQALSVLQEYQHAADQADATCRAAKIAATKKLIPKLQVMKLAATKSGNLQEALALDAQLKIANARVEELSSATSGSGTWHSSGKVAAAKGWQQVKRVQKGDILKIEATGKWCSATSNRGEWTSGPDGNHPENVGAPGVPLPGTPYNALVGRIGEKVFLVESPAEIVVEQDGILELGMNVVNKSLANIDGELQVTITKK